MPSQKYVRNIFLRLLQDYFPVFPLFPQTRPLNWQYLYLAFPILDNQMSAFKFNFEFLLFFPSQFPDVFNGQGY